MPPNLQIHNCCPSLPHFYNAALFKECRAFCNMWLTNIKENNAIKCCFLNCTLILSGAMVKDGPYNPEVIIKGIQKNVSSNAEVWNATIVTIVNKCFNEREKLLPILSYFNNC